jgi:hypothetical protein
MLRQPLSAPRPTLLDAGAPRSGGASSLAGGLDLGGGERGAERDALLPQWEEEREGPRVGVGAQAPPRAVSIWVEERERGAERGAPAPPVGGGERGAASGCGSASSAADGARVRSAR